MSVQIIGVCDRCNKSGPLIRFEHQTTNNLLGDNLGKGQWDRSWDYCRKCIDKHLPEDFEKKWAESGNYIIGGKYDTGGFKEKCAKCGKMEVLVNSKYKKYCQWCYDEWSEEMANNPTVTFMTNPIKPLKTPYSDMTYKQDKFIIESALPGFKVDSPADAKWVASKIVPVYEPIQSPSYVSAEEQLSYMGNDNVICPNCNLEFGSVNTFRAHKPCSGSDTKPLDFGGSDVRELEI